VNTSRAATQGNKPPVPPCHLSGVRFSNGWYEPNSVGHWVLMDERG
jgi:hypothetical protein